MSARGGWSSSVDYCGLRRVTPQPSEIASQLHCTSRWLHSNFTPTSHQLHANFTPTSRNFTCASKLRKVEVGRPGPTWRGPKFREILPRKLLCYPFFRDMMDGDGSRSPSCHGLERRLFLHGSVATSKELHGHFTATSHKLHTNFAATSHELHTNFTNFTSLHNH